MNWARIFFGSLLALLGLLLLLNAADVLDAGNVIGTWWPVVLMAAGLLALASNPGHWAVPTILIVVGAALLLRTTEIVDSFAFVGPLLLVVIGLAVIFGVGFGSRRTVTDGDQIKSFNVFSGAELASHSKNFTGGNIGAVFGGAELDLRDAVPAPGATLDVFAAFGGVELRVPEGWNVVTHGFPVFGGFENVTSKESVGDGAPVLDVKATILFGGLEIKH